MNNDAAVLVVKAQLAQAIRCVIDRRGWGVADAAERLAVSPETLDAVLRGRWGEGGADVGVERMIGWLDAMGVVVQVTTHDKLI